MDDGLKRFQFRILLGSVPIKSNTEPIIRVIAEARSHGTGHRYFHKTEKGNWSLNLSMLNEGSGTMVN